MPREPVDPVDAWLQSLESVLHGLHRTMGMLREVEAALRSIRRLGPLLDEMFGVPQERQKGGVSLSTRKSRRAGN